MNNAVILAWLFDAGTLLGFALLCACAGYGLALLLVPDVARRASVGLNRRFSVRRALRPLEIPRSTERFFYRHHRIVAGLLFAGVSAFFLLYFLDYPADTVLATIAREFGRPLAEIFTGTLTKFFLAANFFIGLFALVMLLRPSLLKPVEGVANRWLSTRRAMRSAEKSRDPVDRFVNRFPRVAGLLVLAGSVYILISFSLVIS